VTTAKGHQKSQIHQTGGNGTKKDIDKHKQEFWDAVAGPTDHQCHNCKWAMKENLKKIGVRHCQNPRLHSTNEDLTVVNGCTPIEDPAAGRYDLWEWDRETYE